MGGRRKHPANSFASWIRLTTTVQKHDISCAIEMEAGHGPRLRPNEPDGETMLAIFVFDPQVVAFVLAFVKPFAAAWVVHRLTRPRVDGAHRVAHGFVPSRRRRRKW